MEQTRASYYLLKKHLLHFDAPLFAKGSHNTNQGSGASSGVQNNSVTGPPADAKKLFGGNNAGDCEAHIRQHIHLVHKAEAANRMHQNVRAHSRPNTGTSASPPGNNTAAGAAAGDGGTGGAASGKSQLGQELEYAVYCLSKSHERFPTPQLSLFELIRAVVQHMSVHRGTQGTVHGEYILRALMQFFGIDKAEAHGRYAASLVDCGCLRAVQGSRGTKTVNDFEKSFFLVQVPAEIADMYNNFDFRDAATRLVCLYCTRSVYDGACELIYLSHSRWLFGTQPPPNTNSKVSVDDPCSMFPEQFRRGILGPMFQFVSTYCLSECKMLETLHDQCAIVRLSGVKFAVAQLTPSNVPSLVLSEESGKLSRCDAPVVVCLGFPEHLADNVIHLGVKKLLDSVEMSCGPRTVMGADLSPEAFRDRLRLVGARMFSLCTEIFFRAESPDAVYIHHSHETDRMRELCGLVDNGVSDQIQMASRSKKPYNGFPTRVPYSLNHRSSTHALSRRSCSAATQILLSLRDACSEFGGCVCAAMFYHGSLILSDCHPYVTALLGLRARWSLFDAAPERRVNIADEVFTGSSNSMQPNTSPLAGSFVTRANGPELWSGFPVRDQMPEGVFADKVFGEPYSTHTASSSGAASPYNAGSPRASSPASPRDTMPGDHRSTSSTMDEEGLIASSALHPFLFPVCCFLSEDLVPLLPKPSRCPRDKPRQQQASPAADASFVTPARGGSASDRYECSDSTDPNAPMDMMSPGFYHGVHLSSSGVDIVLILPVPYQHIGDEEADRRAAGLFPSAAASTAEAIRTRFQQELMTVMREINSLAAQMARSDSVPREVEQSASNSGDNDGDHHHHNHSSGHVDPSVLGGNTGGSGTGSHSGAGSSPATAGGPVTVSPAAAMASSLCLVHDLALGVSEFVDGALGSQQETPSHQRVVPSALMLNRASVFLRETNKLAELLGSSLRLPPRHPDDVNTAATVPFAVEPSTRVILGRSAFNEKDRSGPHSVIYARQSGGQQVFFGVPSAAGASSTLRTVEDQYVQFVSTSRSHTVVI